MHRIAACNLVGLGQESIDLVNYLTWNVRIRIQVHFQQVVDLRLKCSDLILNRFWVATQKRDS